MRAAVFGGNVVSEAKITSCCCWSDGTPPEKVAISLFYVPRPLSVEWSPVSIYNLIFTLKTDYYYAGYYFDEAMSSEPIFSDPYSQLPHLNIFIRENELITKTQNFNY